MCDKSHAELHEIISKKDEQICRLEKRIDELEKRLNIYENAHTPPSQRRFFSKNTNNRTNEKPGQKKGHNGTTRPIANPDRTIVLTAKRCPKCRAILRKPVSIQRRVIEEMPRMQRTVIEFLIHHYHCDNCGEDVIPMHPDLPKEGRFGKNLQSQVTMMKYCDRIPYRKIRKALNRQGIDMSSATILELTRKACNTMRPEYERIMKRIRESRVVYSDETGMKVNGRNCWVWVFVSGKDVTVVVADSRGKKVIEKTLGKDFKGIIVCDGWKPYTGFTDRIQRCWAHLLREADDLAEHHEETLRLSEELHSIFNDCNVMLEGKPPPSEREQIWRAMNARMNILLSMECKAGPVKKLIKKIANGFDYWFTFVLYPYVEPTNNIAERVLRENVIQRKIIGTLRNEKGMFIHETAMSVIPTWVQNGLNPYEELIKIL